MVFTIDFINECFDDFNERIFKNRLPRIPVKLSKSKSNLGMFCTKYKSMPDGSRVIVSKHFSFSTCYDLDRSKLEDVIIHEMIHYLISFEKAKDTAPHGKIFKALMNKINTNFGRNITISTRTLPGEKVTDRNREKKWHIIAVLKLSDGKYGIKVLPRYADKAIFYCESVLRSPQVNDVKLFLHNSPFFNCYPTSTALKMHFVDYEVLKRELTGAQNITYTSDKLKPGRIYQGGELF